MSLIPTPATIEATPAASQAMLQAVKAQIGSVPNLFRLVATSPETLEGYVGLMGALGKGRLPAATQARLLGVSLCAATRVRVPIQILAR